MGFVPVGTDVGAGDEFHEADAAFDQTAGEQAFAAEIVCDGFANAVEFFGGVGLFGDVNGIGRGALHAPGEFVGGDAGVQGGIVRAGTFLNTVDFVDEIERFPLDGGGDAVGILQVENGAFAAAEDGALVDGGEETGSVGGRAGFGGAIGHDHERRQVLILCAEAVGYPGAEAGAAGELEAGGAQVDGGGVVELI